ncbi:helix-turn-helix domain-containing protein [Streptomyces chryseus]|uniref:Helix-turn-helix domain-containing protein n=1 Tax=Streptomyces chryseus TaxID=68186 RepID=A0ABQ3DCW0_9ACTN|nr:helix-turn-helix domain-containing protein [Streptomyces chryseus]GHA83115.1 hypothetical protein GCM10010346_01800 [Streptomyces chryseus]
MDDPDEWLTTRQFATLLQVHIDTVRRWVRTDPDMRVKRLGPAGRSIRVHRSEVDRGHRNPVTVG